MKKIYWHKKFKFYYIFSSHINLIFLRFSKWNLKDEILKVGTKEFQAENWRNETAVKRAANAWINGAADYNWTFIHKLQ